MTTATMNKQAAEYVAQHFADAPADWYRDEIVRLAQAIADEAHNHGTVNAWAQALIVVYTQRLAERTAAANARAYCPSCGSEDLTTDRNACTDCGWESN